MKVPVTVSPVTGQRIPINGHNHPCHFLVAISFFFNDTATTEIYTLSLHDALPIYILLAVDLNAVFTAKKQADTLLYITHADVIVISLLILHDLSQIGRAHV